MYVHGQVLYAYPCYTDKISRNRQLSERCTYSRKRKKSTQYIFHRYITINYAACQVNMGVPFHMRVHTLHKKKHAQLHNKEYNTQENVRLLTVMEKFQNLKLQNVTQFRVRPIHAIRNPQFSIFHEHIHVPSMNEIKKNQLLTMKCAL